MERLSRELALTMEELREAEARAEASEAVVEARVAAVEAEAEARVVAAEAAAAARVAAAMAAAEAQVAAARAEAEEQERLSHASPFLTQLKDANRRSSEEKAARNEAVAAE